MKSNKIICYSKVNLFLIVKERIFNNPNKLHKIDSLFMKCKHLSDDMYIEESKNNVDNICYFKNNKKIVMQDCILKKVLKFLRNKKLIINFYNISVHKRIPMGSGLGGSSSNAGALLRYLSKKENVKFQFIKKDINKLGSDILFFLYDYDFARVYKYGNKIKRIDKFSFNIQLVLTNFYCNTKRVYEKFDLFFLKKDLKKTSFKKQFKLLSDGKFDLLQNDLLFPCLDLYPEFQKKYHEMKKKNSSLLLSGSGSTFFFIYDKNKN